MIPFGHLGDYFPIRADHVYHINDDVSFAKAALCWFLSFRNMPHPVSGAACCRMGIFCL